MWKADSRQKFIGFVSKADWLIVQVAKVSVKKTCNTVNHQVHLLHCNLVTLSLLMFKSLTTTETVKVISF
jgi:hypothetical protein